VVVTEPDDYKPIIEGRAAVAFVVGLVAALVALTIVLAVVGQTVGAVGCAVGLVASGTIWLWIRREQ
jgi:hypothetical protein